MRFKFWRGKEVAENRQSKPGVEGRSFPAVLRESAKSPMEEEIKKLWERLVAAEERLAHLEKQKSGGASADAKIQTLAGELKHHGIHSSLYVEPEPPLEYGAEAQGNVAWTEKNDGTTATV